MGDLVDCDKKIFLMESHCCLSGINTFILSYYLTRSYFPALITSFIFTYCPLDLFWSIKRSLAKLMSLFNKFREKNFLNLLGNIEGKNILEMGCGTGDRAIGLVNSGAKVVGIDIRDRVRDEYRTLKGFKFEQVGGNNIQYESDFDCVISGDVIEHVEDDEDCVKKALRALKPHGVLVFGTPNRYRTIHVLNTLTGRPPKYPLDLGRSEELGDTIHIREYSFRTLKALLKSNEGRTFIFGYWLGLGPRFGIPTMSSKFRFLPYHYLFGVVRKI